MKRGLVGRGQSHVWGGEERSEGRDKRMYVHEAMCGADHPARTDEATTTFKGGRDSSIVLPVDGCKPGLVLNDSEFSPNNLKAGP